MSKFASNGRPGRIGDVHLDVITAIAAPRAHDRSTVATESGSPADAHRQRVPRAIDVEVIISDVAPNFITFFWERDHAAKASRRLETLEMSGEAVQFYDGKKLWLAPGGSIVWVVDAIDSTMTAGEVGVWRATIRLTEKSTFQAQFTPINLLLAAELAASLDGVVDVGQQSTEAVPASIASTIPV